MVEPAHHERQVFEKIKNFNNHIKGISYSLGALSQRYDERIHMIMHNQIDQYQDYLL